MAVTGAEVYRHALSTNESGSLSTLSEQLLVLLLQLINVNSDTDCGGLLADKLAQARLDLPLMLCLADSTGRGSRSPSSPSTSLSLIAQVTSAGSASSLASPSLRRVLLGLSTLLALCSNSPTVVFQFIASSARMFTDPTETHDVSNAKGRLDKTGAETVSYFSPLVAQLSNPADEVVMETIKVCFVVILLLLGLYPNLVLVAESLLGISSFVKSSCYYCMSPSCQCIFITL